MNTTELIQFHKTICDEARSIMEKKNHDYSGASGETPFANFMVAEHLNMCDAKTGILLRITDKIMRINTFIKSGELKVNESVKDSCRDCINYFILLAGMLESTHVNKLEESPFTTEENPFTTEENPFTTLLSKRSTCGHTLSDVATVDTAGRFYCDKCGYPIKTK